MLIFIFARLVPIYNYVIYWIYIGWRRVFGFNVPAIAYIMCIKEEMYYYSSGLIYTNSISRPYLRWLVFGCSTYCHVRLAASILAALISSLIWNWNYSYCRDTPLSQLVQNQVEHGIHLHTHFRSQFGIHLDAAWLHANKHHFTRRMPHQQ